MKFFWSILVILPFTGLAQTPYKPGDIVADMKIDKILNYTSASSSLNKLKHTITIIDFFGTWCAPCIKALPDLEEYKNKFGDDIRILLVSTEPEIKLTKFISNRKKLIFPIVADEGNLFTNAFKPPSYPYTVILDRNLTVLSITNAADLSESILEKFINDSKIKVETKTSTPVSNMQQKEHDNPKVFTGSNNTLVKLSQDFMYAAKTNEEVTSYINQLSNLNYEDLLGGLKNDDDKKAFWINLYNAYTNASLHKDPDQYKSRNKFFKNKNIVVAHKIFSLDKIEHGILRKSSVKWSLGYFSKLFPGKTEKQLRVDKLDYRVHFALNCGARSCPPIAFYNPENLNAQLDLATTAYLSSEAFYHKETNILNLPTILSWFRRDFGGKKKMIELLKAKQLLSPDVNPEIVFRKYDWTLYLDNYKQ